MDKPGFKLWQGFLLWQAQVDAALLPYNLTQTSFAILSLVGWLTQDQDQVRQKQITVLAGMQKMQVSLTVQRLLKFGFISVVSSDIDRREKIILLTERGKTVLEETIPLIDAIDVKLKI